MRSIAILLLSMTVGLAACDYVEDPTPPQNNGGGGGGTEQVTRKVLLEDITGHRCNNCPRAARIAQTLKDDFYGEDLIIVGVHAGSFAPPYPPIGDGQYDTDHRTPAGTAYQQAFQVTFFPAGLVSRKPFESSTIVSEGSWGSAVDAIIGEPSAFELWIDTIIVAGGNVSTVVKLHFVENVTGDHNLVVYLTEDQVIDWQLDSEATPPDVPDYPHPHMLRTNLNGTWGQPVVTGAALAGDTVTVELNDVALNPAWNTTKCALVAWVYNTETEEVMQAEERKFQP
jgi:hypothetical protein